MTRGLVRWQREGDLHFVAASCWQRLPYLHDCFALAEDGLERTRTRYGMNVVGYVFMPEHLHLLVDEPETGVLFEAIKMLKLSVALRQERRPLWQKRYYGGNLCTHDDVVEVLRYIHRNPVKRGLVTEPEDWPWSSYRHYVSGEPGRVGVDSAWAREEPRWKSTVLSESSEEDTAEIERYCTRGALNPRPKIRTWGTRQWPTSSP